MPPAQREGVRFARKVLVTTWDSVLDVLSIPLESSSQTHQGVYGGSNIAFMLGSNEGKKEQPNRTRDTICLSLDGLRRSARLCCTLGIKTRCETVLAQLANASCSGDTLPLKRSKNMHFSGPIKLHAAQVLSMDALLSVGLELGTHVPKCWKHVFRCCAFISQLEHVHFTGSNVDLSPVSRQMPELSSPMSESSTVSDYLGEGSSDVGSVNDDNKQPNNDNVDTSGGILPPEDASRAIYALSAAVDRLYEHAANTLHMSAIMEFLKSLVYASQTQLFGGSSENFGSSNTAVSVEPQVASSPTTLHLYRMTDFMLRCIRNGNRPLLHLMRSWIVISEHFAEGACHFDRYVSKLAITSLSDVLLDMLTNRNELPHFWFHETLFKPFENILSLELYGDEEQDQILGILCDIVETHTNNIKSGWRPLFASLRLLRVYPRQYLDALEPELRPPAVFDVISSFLSNKNNSIFAAAAVDCILCLLKYVRGTSLYEESHEDSRSDTDSNASESYLQELCLPALEFLSRVSKRLAAIYIQPSTLVFHGAHSIRLFDMPAPPVSPATSPSTSPQKSPAHIDPRSATTAESITAIDETGILRVWFLLLEGLTSAVVTCPRKYQPQTLEVLFEILKSITTIPGPHFSVFAITHLLLPMLRSWVRRGNRNRSYWESTAANFKHACGLATELIVEEISKFLNMQGASECVPGLMKQVLDVMTDCVSQPVESIARLGCSCLRHLLLSAGPVFTEDLWQIVCRGLQDAVQSTLSGLKEIVACFQHGSLGVSGDEGMVVKVVARREGTMAETMRLQQIAEQVFLLDSQLMPRKDSRDNALDDEDQRSFVFVVTTVENKDKPEAGKRITFRGLLVGLLSHQLLLQTLGSILLEAENNSASAQNALTVTSENYEHHETTEVNLPGLLCYLSPASLSVLFDCLMESHTAAYEFNSRPGLRSLIQKLSKLNYPANLLRQSTSAFTYYLQTLFQICRHSGEHFSSSHIKRILTGERGSIDKDSHIHPHLHVHNHTHREGVSENRHNDLLKGERNVDWIVRRLNEACNQLSSVFIRLHATSVAEQYFGGQDVDLDRSWSINTTPLSSPAREPTRTIGSDETLYSPGHKRRNGSPKKYYEDDPRALDIERQQHMILRRREDDLLQLNTWTSLVIMMLELLMNLPTLQFKAVLPAVFPAVTSLINTGTDTKVSQLVCDVIRRVGSIYGIL